MTVRRARPGIVADDEVRRELAREAQVLALLGPHEAVLGLVADASAGDPPRLILEGGELLPLERVLAAGEPALGLAAALALVVPLAEALGEAHARGIVHGALAPAVVLVTTRGTPKLVGWSDAVAAGLERAPSLDATLRDPAWMAPEVIMGEPPAAAADVFALACLLARVATGDQPTAANGGRGAGARSGEPSSVLPSSIARVVARAMARHPGDRHDTATDLATALVEAASVPFDRAQLASALARRGLAPPARARPAPTPARAAGPSALPFVAIVAGLAVWGGAVELLAGDADAARGGSPAAAASGQLRILAHPWAHVSLDGAPLDTTPIGSPVAVSPGRHVVDFVHPQAPKAQRVIDVRPGQTVVVDVILDLPKPTVDAGVDASP